MSRLLEKHHGQKTIILIDEYDEPTGIVIEVNYARDGNMEAACKEVLEQIDKRQYADAFYDETIKKVLKYGIACYKNRCMVMLADDGEN